MRGNRGRTLADDGMHLLVDPDAIADGRWIVWMQPLALGLRKELEWQFKNKTMAVAWTACAILVGLRKARELLE